MQWWRLLGAKGNTGAAGANGADGVTLVDRGDAAMVDFTESMLTGDSMNHDLDLSAIVPAGATWVLMAVTVMAAAANTFIAFTAKAFLNPMNGDCVTCQTAGSQATQTVWVQLNAGRVIQYASNFAIATDIVNITVRGWTT